MYRIVFILLITAVIQQDLHPMKGDDGLPEFALFVTGADLGVIEPCGCSGGQLGGIGRRATLLEALVPMDAPKMIISTGGLPGGTDTLQQIRYEIILLCLDEMEYDAVALGPEELALGLDQIRNARELVEFPFLLTNVTYEEDDLPFLPFLVKEVNGITVRIFALIAESYQDELPPEISYLPPEDALLEALDQAGDADLTLVLFRGDRREAKALDPFLPDPGLVLYSYSHSEPQIFDFGKREGEIRFLSPGDRGRFLFWLKTAWDEYGEVAFFDPVQEPIELHYPESEIIGTYISWYKERVISENILSTMVERLPAPEGAPYLAEETCVLCHENASATWKMSTHAHAYETLVKVKREFDPECLKCHTIGMDYKTGFSSAEKTPHLVDVGCESCHGPCADHVSSAGRVPTPLKIDCITCHNLDHSTEFLFEEYWPKIQCLSDDKEMHGSKKNPPERGSKQR